jgi:hypothetical protein
MKAKLIKTEVNYLLEDDKGVVIASTSLKEGINSLSKQNCDEIFGVVDAIDVVYKQVRNGFDGVIDSFTEAFGKQCINKAMELNKDKVFTEEDMRKAYFDGYNDKDENRYFNPSKSLQQPVEIEVEVVYERDCYSSAGRCDKSTMSQCIICTPVYPLEDQNGCLILRKK